MKNLLLLLVVFLSLASNSEGQEINYLRYLYIDSSTNGKSCDSLIKLTEKSSDEEWQKRGYFAVGTMKKSQYVLDPVRKLFYFNKGKNILNELIESKPQDLELRFLRYCAQKKTPSFLNYKNELETDEAFINSKLKKDNRNKTEQFIYPIFNKIKDE